MRVAVYAAVVVTRCVDLGKGANMKRRIWMIVLVLCLLLCSCAGDGRAEQLEEAASWTKVYRAAEARAYVELYKLLRPDAYIGCSGGSGTGLDCCGPDVDEFEAWEVLPKYITLNYDAEAFDPRPAHAVPRQPESEIRFDDGVTLRMERSVYPVFPEYVRYTMESDRNYFYGGLAVIKKYVDGEWHTLPQNFNTSSMGYTLTPGEPDSFYIIQPAQWMGEGLYRVERDDGEHYAEFVVSADAEPLETLPPPDSQSLFKYNCFSRLELPESCVVKLSGSVSWPTLSGSFRADEDVKADDGLYKILVSRLKNELLEETAYTANEDEAELIWPYEAAAIVLPELFDIEGEFILSGAAMVYAVQNGEAGTLRPTWVFTVEQNGVSRHFAVNAVTGEMVTVEWE